MSFVTIRDEKGREKEVSADVWRLMASSKEKGDTRRGHTLVKGKKGPLAKTSPVGEQAKAPGFEPDEIAEKVKKGAGSQTADTKVAPPAEVPEEPASASQEEAEQEEANAAPVSNNAAPSKDDLTKIEGIGAKVAELLGTIGITSFKQLVDADPVAINQALDAANLAAKKAQVTKWKMEAQQLSK